MRNILLMFAVVVLSSMHSCRDDYDDSSLWRDIDGIWNDLTELQERLDALNGEIAHLSAIVAGDAVTGITTDADGNYVITYKDTGNVERTVTIVTAEQLPDVPVLGVKEEDGVLYWTLFSEGATTWLTDGDGERIPVGGKAPQIAIDSEGYWTVNGRPITGSDGQPVRAGALQDSIFRDVEITADGNAVFTLGDGSQVTVQVFSAFNMEFDVELTTVVDDPPADMTVRYTLTGPLAQTAMVRVVRTEKLEAVLDAQARTIDISFDNGFEEGCLMVMIYDGGDNILIKPLWFTVYGDATGEGIGSAADLVAFAQAVRGGQSLARFRDASGNVVLTADIDMAGYRDWIPAGSATTTAGANSGVTYTTVNPFTDVFDGQGHSITNINWEFDCSDGNLVYGLFGTVEGGTIRNLTIGSPTDGSRITLKGTSTQGNAVGAFAGYAGDAVIENCVNYAAIAFAGDNAGNISVRMGGIAGVVNGSRIGGTSFAEGCVNYGEISCGTIANTGNGANSAMSVGGIAAFISSGSIASCENNGAVSAPSGRGGGLVATATGGTIADCTNNGLIQDDVNGVFAGASAGYGYKRMGGLAGGTAADCTITGCVNNGNVFSSLGCRTGGFVGHNSGTVTGCTNNGVILSDHTVAGSDNHGPGWACGYNQYLTGITNCTIGGRVGDYSVYYSNPSAAPEALYGNAVCHGQFSVEDNGLSNDTDAYYAWTVEETYQLHGGVEYTKYYLRNIDREVYVVTADLSNPEVEIATAVANDIMPNPNGNGNSNNGKNLRETLSEISTRKRAEGMNVVAGVNSGFFDSNDGVLRGMHIEDGEPVFVNTPEVRSSLTNHRPGFTFFTDRTISFANRDFTGLLEVGGVEYEYYSVNDTIVRLSGPMPHDANLYTHRYVETPHTGLRNEVGTDALFITGVCPVPMTVNGGWAEATVSAVADGRSSAVSAPYVSNHGEWVLQVTGEKADRLAQAVSAGATVRIRADVPIGGDASKPVAMHNASMYRFVQNGVFSKPSASDADRQYPATIVGSDAGGTKVFLLCVDGNTSTPKGLNYYELYRVITQLGFTEAVRLDGGGSTTMWTYRDGTGSVVNTPCDSRGERSCMNYMFVRIKQ